jgi:hypothetical protein
MFDYRILHRGLANDSPDPRPIAYFTYARPWFRDATNYPDTSILPAAFPVEGAAESHGTNLLLQASSLVNVDVDD